MSDEERRCAQSSCDLPATFSFVWPGHGRTYACDEHTNRAVGVAEALGLSRDSLDIQPVDESQ